MYPIAKTCPTCGSSRIRLVKSNYATMVRGRKVIVDDLERQECPVCGEVLFYCAAMKRIQSHWPRKKKMPA